MQIRVYLFKPSQCHKVGVLGIFRFITKGSNNLNSIFSLFFLENIRLLTGTPAVIMFSGLLEFDVEVA